jgi:hypothetical protein
MSLQVLVENHLSGREPEFQRRLKIGAAVQREMKVKQKSTLTVLAENKACAASPGMPPGCQQLCYSIINSPETAHSVQAVIVVTLTAQLNNSTRQAEDKTGKFLKKIYYLSRDGHIDAGIDEVIDYFDKLLQQGDWPTCANVLLRADVPKLDAAVALAMLSMTLMAKHDISTRPVFYSRLRHVLVARRGRDEARQLLTGLE